MCGVVNEVTIQITSFFLFAITIEDVYYDVYPQFPTLCSSYHYTCFLVFVHVPVLPSIYLLGWLQTVPYVSLSPHYVV